MHTSNLQQLCRSLEQWQLPPIFWIKSHFKLQNQSAWSCHNQSSSFRPFLVPRKIVGTISSTSRTIFKNSLNTTIISLPSIHHKAFYSIPLCPPSQSFRLFLLCAPPHNWNQFIQVKESLLPREGPGVATPGLASHLPLWSCVNDDDDDAGVMSRNVRNVSRRMITLMILLGVPINGEFFYRPFFLLPRAVE